MNYGWVCPKCNSVYSPSWFECIKCNSFKKDASFKLPSNFILNADGSYDVDGDVEITSDLVKDGKLTIKFGKVNGCFDCNGNRLTSLEGAPKEVGRDFGCSYNQLTNLEGAPKEVGGSFYRDDNAKEFTEKEIRKICNVKGEIISSI